MPWTPALSVSVSVALGWGPTRVGIPELSPVTPAEHDRDFVIESHQASLHTETAAVKMTSRDCAIRDSACPGDAAGIPAKSFGNVRLIPGKSGGEEHRIQTSVTEAAGSASLKSCFGRSANA